MTLTLGSLFAGIGGFDLGFQRAGIATRWLVEWDTDCQRVLAERFPGVPIHGDITTVDPADLAPVDIITFGSPCQDLSVAGKRAGLDGSRSGLFYEACRIIAAVRPAIAVWENVPGAFSSLQGRDFGAVLDALAELGALDIGWRVLDAQWFGVAQRRRRVFVVADFRGRRCGEILAFADGLSGHPAPRRTAGQGTTHDVAPSLAASGRGTERAGESRGPDPVIASTVSAKWAKGTGGPSGDEVQNLVAHTLSANGADASEDGTGRGTPLVVDLAQVTSPGNYSNPQPGDPCHPLTSAANQSVVAWVGSYAGGGGAASERPPTLQASGGQDERGVRNPLIAFTNRGNDTGSGAERLRAAAHGALPMVAFKWNSAQGIDPREELAPTMHGTGTTAIAFSSKDSGNDAGDIAPTLRAMPHDTSHSNGGGQVAVAFTQNQRDEVRELGDLAGALPAQPGMKQQNYVAATTVRRLTPTECARLQGFPDDWLNTTPPLSDSAKYRMLGNAVCVNVAEWLGKRIEEVLR